MKRHQLVLQGNGDFCARSSRVALSHQEIEEDPEIRFEEELIAALESVTPVAAEAGTEPVSV